MVEAGFQLEDFFDLVKRGMRSIRNLTQALETMENLFDLWGAMEPMLKSTVPNLINYMDNLEQKGVFRTYSAMLEVRAKVAQHYPSEEITAMGDGFVVLLSLLKKLSKPEMIDFINRLMELPLGSIAGRQTGGRHGHALRHGLTKRPGRVWGWPWNSPRPWASSRPIRPGTAAPADIRRYQHTIPMQPNLLSSCRGGVSPPGRRDPATPGEGTTAGEGCFRAAVCSPLTFPPPPPPEGEREITCNSIGYRGRPERTGFQPVKGSRPGRETGKGFLIPLK